jgi:hypothetical protein
VARIPKLVPDRARLALVKADNADVLGSDSTAQEQSHNVGDGRPLYRVGEAPTAFGLGFLADTIAHDKWGQSCKQQGG